MNRALPFASFLVVAAAGLATLVARADEGGPVVEIAPDHRPAAPTKPVVKLGAGTVPDVELGRGMNEQRFRAANESSTSTAIGGYGEFQLRGTASGRDAPVDWIADVSRLVVFVTHSFNDAFRAYAEIEVEHALACAGCKGEVELEQAYVDWKLLGDRLGLRAGLVLMPMGIINEWHEPPVFNGVVRPRVETVVIPSTWREIGLGAFGRPTEWLRYEVYATTAFDPQRLSANGLAAARQQGSLAQANALAVVGRLEVEPALGMVASVSGYGSEAGPNGRFYDVLGNRLELSVPVLGFSMDARYRGHGIEVKALYAEWRLPAAKELMNAMDAQGQPAFDPNAPVPTVIRGAYIEGGYDVLRPFEISHRLVGFARIEAYDTQAEVPDGSRSNPSFAVREYTFGASYHPIQQVVFKADYQLRNRRVGFDETQINFGFGFMY